MYQPVKLKPASKDYLWGGTELKKSFNKKSDLDILAESWELSTHKDGLSEIASGSHAGKTLKAWIDETNGAILGSKAPDKLSLPVLIKFIDAKQALSIQVHPDDEFAKRVEGDNGKTEMWIVLEAKPDAFLYFGVKEDITKEEAAKRIQEGSFEEVLRAVPVHAGDIFMIPAGTIHAIGAGIVICEIQQSSNVTYRLYDYNRKDANGNGRELHIEKGLEVSNLNKKELHTDAEEVLMQNDALKVELLKSCKYFNTFSYTLKNSEISFSTSEQSFAALIVVDGEVTLKGAGTSLDLIKGDTCFIPAQVADYTVEGNGQFIFVTI